MVLHAFFALCVSLGIILIPQATFVPNFVSFTASITEFELAHGEKRILSHSPSLFDAPGIKALALQNYFLTNFIEQ